MAAYARRSLQVTPEVVEYVAKELRLDLVHSPISAGVGDQRQIDAQRAMNALLDLFVALEGIAGNSAADSHGAIEVSKDEPYI
jgi:hypothetical protein